MKLSSIPLLTATLAAIAASGIADGEPVTLFKRQSPDRQAVEPRLPGQPYVSSDPSSHRVFHRAPHQGQTHWQHQPHRQPLHAAGHLQAQPHHLQAHPPQPQLEHSREAMLHNFHQQPLHAAGHLQAQLHHLQPHLQTQSHHLPAHLPAHPPQPQLELSREAMLHNFPDEGSYQNNVFHMKSNPRKRHDRHTAVAIANEDAARSNRLAVYGAKVAKSKGIPSDNRYLGDWDAMIGDFKDKANTHQQKTESHKRSAYAPGLEHAIRVREADAAVRDALRSKEEADWTSDETWRMIHRRHSRLSRKGHEDEAEKEFMQTHAL